MDILCLGVVVADAFGRGVDRVPEKGSMSLFDSVELHLGGCAANAAVDLAKLGVPVGVSCKVARDGFGEFCVKTMKDAGVDLEGVLYSKTHSTSVSFVLVPSDGNRRILHTLGANADLREEDVEDRLLQRAKCLFVAGAYILPGLDGPGLARLLRRARGLGLTTCVDCAVNDRIADWLSLIEPSFPHLDIFFPSEEEAQRITGLKEPRKIVSFLRERGVKIAGVKLGERGSAVLCDEGYFEVRPYDVKVADTCGAGDSFMAGFLAALMRGKSPKEAAQFGNAVSAFCIQSVGATTGIQPMVEVEKFQKKAKTR